MKNYIRKIIFNTFPIKTYGYYFCDNCYNFHYGWYKKIYGKDGWFRITEVDYKICKEHKKIYKDLIKRYCLPKYKQKYKKHNYQKGICSRCKNKKVLNKPKVTWPKALRWPYNNNYSPAK